MTSRNEVVNHVMPTKIQHLLQEIHMTNVVARRHGMFRLGGLPAVAAVKRRRVCSKCCSPGFISVRELLKAQYSGKTLSSAQVGPPAPPKPLKRRRDQTYRRRTQRPAWATTRGKRHAIAANGRRTFRACRC